MKKASPISILALVVAIFSLGYSFSIQEQPLSQAEIDVLVDEGIERKERGFIDEYNPFMQRIYREMLMPDDYAKIEKEPKTIEGLFRPLIQIITNLTV